ncbi:P-loop containing nucleoside triphosphate hydrolase protein [Sistotremastrum niveocremeum HHB9708]|uniref:p-loop containing nucleoside triphosphate hydrolase protein n=1 Tax=Sistotremastrum niveocremeum HHB9708 TaxID=1314777 RepID=A0A164VA96_9AGAM|nr:P-loop containing nucleoside triphosphate hydrolase protein [Sistotremastrum niveocremeum HHB9708]
MDESNRKPEVVESKHSEDSVDLPDDHAPLELSNGCAQNSLRQASTIMYKRWLVLKRSWFTPLLMVVIAIAGSCIPLFFMNGRQETCAVDFDVADNIPLFLPLSPLYGSIFGTAGQFAHLLTAPPNLLPLLGDITDGIQTTNLIDNATFVQTIGSEFHNLTLGGVSVDFSSNSALVAWEASAPSISGPSLLNLVSNLLYNKALNSTGRNLDIANIISANYQSLPAVDGGSLFALKWVAFFGATMGVFPAFFALYVSKERRSSVQAMQLSNGLSNPIGLWLGHLLFDGIFCIIVSTLITIVFATASNQFHGLGFFWLIMTLYGLTAALFAYCACLITKSPLAAFAIVAGYQVIMFILYLAGYLLTLTYAKTSEAAHIITIIHFTVSLASPVASVLRACLISVNLFSLLCTDGTFSTKSLGAIDKFGGPILYLVVYGLILFSILVLTDSGSRRPSWSLLRGRQRRVRDLPEKLPVPTSSTDVVAAEAARAMESDDALRVLGVSKKFSGATGKAVDDVSFGVSTNTVFAMLGPNGAGKTTTFNMIRGDVVPDEGEVLIQGTSAIRHPSIARLSLGVCPQFTAIDPHLTVREHLRVYGMLKGVSKAGRLEQDIETLATAVALLPYIDRLASKLSGGNQRKLALAISLMGNPAVVLIDEFSTGLDPKTKRDMWKTFERVAVGKAIVITTHSMEEASNLATKVGILAGKLLAVGTTASLVQPYAAYEVHFSARTRRMSQLGSKSR